jgi:DNA-binding transcriptional ArsR family regulator
LLDDIKIHLYNKTDFYNEVQMQDVCYIDQVEQAMTLLKPQRLEILKRLDEPRTCLELAAMFDDSAQKIYYHIKALENAGLVDKIAERRVRGTLEGTYQAHARSYWLAPKLVGQIGSVTQARDQASLRVLLGLAEEVIEDVGKLGEASVVGQVVPSLSMSAHVLLPDGKRRAEFMRELQTTFQDIARKYGVDAPAEDPANFRLVVLCYPKQEQE